MSPTAAAVPPLEEFRHEALLYSGEDEFLEGTLPFIREGLADGEPILVVVSAEKIRALKAELRDDAEGVRFADMAGVGLNPARIIPAWREFVAEQGATAKRFRGIGEPIWAERTPAELIECQRHETLLNVAFAGSGAWWLLCPYDTSTLDPSVIDEAERSHPFIARAGDHRESASCRDLDTMATPFDAPLPDRPTDAHETHFGENDLAALRPLVADHAARAGLDARRTGELVLSVHEIAANSIRHADGKGVLRLWREGPTVICEISDDGNIDEPLVGCVRPRLEQTNGRGLWLANQLCDLVQLRSFPTGTVTRIHMRRQRSGVDEGEAAATAP